MRNFAQNGEHLDVTPSVAYASGELVILGDLVGVAVTNIPAGGTGVICCEGVFWFTKAPAAAVLQGDHAHWDPTTKQVVAHGGSHPIVGIIVLVKGNDVLVKIHGHTLAHS